MTRPTLALALVALAFTACTTVPKAPGSATRSTPSETILARSPIEVAVAPVVNASGAQLPASELREAFQKELVERRYTPLALEYVDRKVVDASYTPGASEESATLTITIEKWDASLWTTHSAITARITASLIDARGSGSVLWTATADQRFDFIAVREHLSTEGARIRFACDGIAAEVLARLPARTAKPGRTTPG